MLWATRAKLSVCPLYRLCTHDQAMPGRDPFRFLFFCGLEVCQLLQPRTDTLKKYIFPGQPNIWTQQVFGFTHPKAKYSA